MLEPVDDPLPVRLTVVSYESLCFLVLWFAQYRQPGCYEFRGQDNAAVVLDAVPPFFERFRDDRTHDKSSSSVREVTDHSGKSSGKVRQ